MASKAKNLSLLLLLLLITLLSPLHTAHARDSQLFNKASTTTTTNDVVVPKAEPTNNGQQEVQEPNFQPENENPYGLHPHGSSQLPPSVTTPYNNQPAHKYLPKNYNPVAYVTQPEDINDAAVFTEDNRFDTNPNGNYYNNGARNYVDSQPEDEEPNNRNYKRKSYDNYYYNGGSSFNSPTRTRSRSTRVNGFQPQGMSDTRVLENGKYFYDVNTERYSSNHPYERLKGADPTSNNEYNRRNIYGNGKHSYELNSMGGYQNEFQEEDINNMLP